MGSVACFKEDLGYAIPQKAFEYVLLHEMYKLNICNKSLLTIMMINLFKFIVISYFVKDTNLRRVYTGATWPKGDAFTLEQPLANLKHATWSYTAKLPTTEFACC